MFKRILIAVLAAQLVITPAQAKQECTKAFVGIDDAIILFLASWLIVKTFEKLAVIDERDELKKQLEQERAKQPAANTCLM